MPNCTECGKSDMYSFECENCNDTVCDCKTSYTCDYCGNEVCENCFNDEESCCSFCTDEN